MAQAKPPTFELKAGSATFRIADGERPLEEVSTVSRGRFRGRELTSLQTVRIYPTGKARDVEEGAGILYLTGKGRAAYSIVGELSSTVKWREQVTGKMTFTEDCIGGLKDFAKAKALFTTLVDSKGKSVTKVWLRYTKRV